MLIKIHPENPSERHIKMVTECLLNGGVIIYPTDTVYGLGCSISSSKAIERVVRIKGIRPEKANFSFICSDLSNLSLYSKPIPNTIYKMMKRHLPGPYTFIIDANNNVPRIFHSRKKTVGIRVPDNNIPLDIVRTLGNPIMSTSIHDEDDLIEYTTNPELIHEKYERMVDMVIDGGFGGNIPSTVIDCTTDVPIVIRKGKGSVEDIY